MTHGRLLQQLIHHIPPPEKPDLVLGASLNTLYGPMITLPEEYRWFLDVYGPGWFTEEGRSEQSLPALQVLDLVSDASQEYVDVLLLAANESHELDPVIFPAPYPALPGVLPWGTFDNGYTFYWWVDGPPDSWRVIVDVQSDVLEYKYSMLEFLVVNLTEVAGDKFFDDGEQHFSGYMTSSEHRAFVQSYFKGKPL